MIQIESLSAYGTTGTRNRRRETTLGAEIAKAIKGFLDKVGGKYVNHTVTTVQGGSEDSAFIVLVYDVDKAEPSKKSK